LKTTKIFYALFQHQSNLDYASNGHKESFFFYFFAVATSDVTTVDTNSVRSSRRRGQAEKVVEKQDVIVAGNLKCEILKKVFTKNQ